MTLPSPIRPLLCCLLAAAASGADIRWQTTEQEIAFEPGQKEATVEFGFTNEGEEALVIRDVRASCGCTRVILKRKRFAAGESGSIGVIFSAGRRRGINRATLTVYAEGFEQAVGYLHLSADIPTPVSAVPSIVRWSPGEKRGTKTVQLKLDRRFVDGVEAVDNNSQQFRVEVVEPGQGKGDPVLRITPAREAGMLRDVITVTAGDASYNDEVRIYAFAQAAD